MTNAEARFNKSLRPRKPEGSLGQTAQDVHLDSHTAPELWFCPAFFFALPSLPCYITFTFHENGVLDVCLCWPSISLTQWHWCSDWYSVTLTAVTVYTVTDTQWHWLHWLYRQWLILSDCSDYTRSDWYPVTLTAVTIYAVTDTQSFHVSITSFSTHELWVSCTRLIILLCLKRRQRRDAQPIRPWDRKTDHCVVASSSPVPLERDQTHTKLGWTGKF